MNFKPLILCMIFGMLVVLLDFSDTSPMLSWVGNLDHIFGSSFWYPMEVILPLASIATFILFGRECFDSGKAEGTLAFSFPKNIKALLPLLLFLVLLGMIYVDDILKVLGIDSALRVPEQSPYYWLPMMAIYPIGSIALFFVFGKVCFDLAKDVEKKNLLHA